MSKISPRSQAVKNFLKFLNKSDAQRAMPKAPEPAPEPSNELDNDALEALKSLADNG